MIHFRKKKDGLSLGLRFFHGFDQELKGMFFGNFYGVFIPNVLQIPSEKVFRPKKTTPNTVSEGVWSCR